MLKANNACSSRAHPKSISLPSSAAIQFCVTLTTNIELEDVVAALTKLDYFDERPNPHPLHALLNGESLIARNGANGHEYSLSQDARCVWVDRDMPCTFLLLFQHETTKVEPSHLAYLPIVHIDRNLNQIAAVDLPRWAQS